MILAAAATYTEIEPLVGKPIANPTVGMIYPLDLGGKLQCNLLLTGVGAASTSHHLAWHLASGKYTHVINLGIAGSYNPELVVGDVATIHEDSFADYGVDNQGEFLSLFEAWLTDPNAPPYSKGQLLWPHADLFQGLQTKRAKAITVSTSSGSFERIENLRTKYNPDLETMEGAAVFFSCLTAKVPFICLRAVSNRVEPRNLSGWDIPKATRSLADAALQTIKKI